MKLPRRKFLKTTALSGVFAGFGMNELFADINTDTELYKSAKIDITLPEERMYYEPLEEVHVNIEADTGAREIKISDGRGNIYHSFSYKPSFSFQAGGALGFQVVSLHDKKGKVIDWAVFPVNCQTQVKDDKEEFSDFMDILYKTLTSSYAGLGKTVRYNNKFYTYYSSWLQDHVFVAEAMKYFMKDIKTGIDLYADGQRKDGLIWDNYKHPYPEIQSYWEYRFDYGGFTYRPEDPRSSAIFVRIPVENIGEHTFIEGLYYAWKATGDTEWMATILNNALKAVEFATSSPWYWSEEKQLLKRPFTIDRWDFQSDFDAKISETGSDFMGVNPGKTHYGIMFGDNTCMANACGLLSEMLQSAGRDEEAERMKNLGRSLWQRLNNLSWKGNFYRHWYPLNPERDVDFGVDTAEQVTLSNAMALIRGLDHDKCVKIIQTYQRIREEMPKSSPGEWYMCYPPFEKGWHVNKWEYMNGGVSPILAGDLALGAFEHGYESYGVDILQRLHQLAIKSGYEIKGGYKGKMPEEPQRNFTPLDLEEHANIDFVSDGNAESPGWVGGPEADFRNLPTGEQKLEGVTFKIIDPEKNNRRGCIAVSQGKENNGTVNVQAGQKARSFYILHTLDGHGVAGTLFVRYDDGTYYARYINERREIGHFWYPVMSESRKGIPNTRIAWRGPAKEVKDVGIYAFGMDNPHPEKTIKSFEFVNPQASNWVIFAVTLSDGPHYFEPSIVSTIPNHWGAAHVMKAMIEGLAGIKNTGLAFDKATLSPRWELAGVNTARATAKYESSGGYLSYSYQKINEYTYEIEFTGNSMETELQFLVPDGKKMNTLQVNNESFAFKISNIENSNYATALIPDVGIKKVVIGLV